MPHRRMNTFPVGSLKRGRREAILEVRPEQRQRQLQRQHGRRNYATAPAGSLASSGLHKSSSLSSSSSDSFLPEKPPRRKPGELIRRSTHESFLGQVMMEGVQDDYMEDVASRIAMDNFSDLIALFSFEDEDDDEDDDNDDDDLDVTDHHNNKENNHQKDGHKAKPRKKGDKKRRQQQQYPMELGMLDREMLRDSIDDVFHREVQVLMPRHLIVMQAVQEEMRYEDLLQAFGRAAAARCRMHLVDMIWEAAGIFHFLLRVETDYYCATIRAMVYVNDDSDGKIVHVEVKNAKIRKDSVIENLRTFFDAFDGTGKEPSNFREIVTNIFDPSLIVERAAARVTFDEFYRQLKHSIRKKARTEIDVLRRHILGAEHVVHVYFPDKHPDKRGTIHGIAEASGGKIVKLNSVDTEEDPQDDPFQLISPPVKAAGNVKALSASKYPKRPSFFPLETEMAEVVHALPDQTSSRPIAANTAMIPTLNTGDVIKVSMERPVVNLLSLRHIPIYTDARTKQKYAGGAYLTEDWVQRKMVLHTHDGIPVAACHYRRPAPPAGATNGAIDHPLFNRRREAGMTEYIIYGTRPIRPNDPCQIVEENVVMFPWYLVQHRNYPQNHSNKADDDDVRSSFSCQSHKVYVWNGKSYDAIYEAYQKKQSERPRSNLVPPPEPPVSGSNDSISSNRSSFHRTADAILSLEWLPPVGRATAQFRNRRRTTVLQHRQRHRQQQQHHGQQKILVKEISTRSKLGHITVTSDAVRGLVAQNSGSTAWQVTIGPGVDPVLMICIATCM